MTRGVVVCSVTLVLTLSLGCGQAPATANTHDADVHALKDDTAKVIKAFQAKDIDQIAAHYASDAVIMAPGAPAVRGPEGAKAAYKEWMADPAYSVQIDVSRTEVAGSGDIGYVQGTYVMGMSSPIDKKPMKDKGSWVVVYRKQDDGSWKATEDIATSEVLVAPAPASRK